MQVSRVATFLPYVALVCVAISFALACATFPGLTALFTDGAEGFYLSLALLFVTGYGLNRYAPKTAIPTFVWAILFGMALQLPLRSLTGDMGALALVVELLAAFVLFAGGVEVPVKSFKKYFAPIAALSLLGTILCVVVFAYVLVALTGFFSISVPTIALLVLAAILASTDPTTIIPTLERLHFRKPFLRDIAVSEGAVNDVVGMMLTRFFLVVALGTTVASVGEGVAPLFTRAVLDPLALQLLWGVLVGLVGAWILRVWGESVREAHWSDPALFLAVPVFCFALGSLVGGSGFLAAFVAGLLFEAKVETREAHAFFSHLVDHFVKPVIFILLGALVPLGVLMATLSFGVSAALVFMFLVRPSVVFVSLAPWMLAKRSLLSWHDTLFLSFIRETGAVSAILVLVAVAHGVAASEFVFAIGTWVILITLMVEPFLTSLVAKRLGVVA